MTVMELVEQIEVAGGSLAVDGRYIVYELPVQIADQAEQLLMANKPAVMKILKTRTFNADDLEFLRQVGIATEEVKQ